MGMVLKFLGGWKGMLIGALLISTSAFAGGWQVNGWRWESRLAAANEEALEAEKQANRLRRQLNDSLVSRETKTVETVQQNSGRLADLVGSDRSCLVGAPVIRVLNATILGQLSEPAGEGDAD